MITCAGININQIHTRLQDSQCLSVSVSQCSGGSSPSCAVMKWRWERAGAALGEGEVSGDRGRWQSIDVPSHENHKVRREAAPALCQAWISVTSE